MKKLTIIVTASFVVCLLVVCVLIFLKKENSVAKETPLIVSKESGEPSPSVTSETQVIVNEQDDKKGMIYLGLSMDELIRILDKNDMGHAKTEDSEGSGDYLIESGLNNCYLGIYFDGEKDLVDCIEVSGPEPVPATATQKGLNIGDSLEQMVELYGDDYTTDTIEFTDGDTFTIYTYKLSDHSFDVEFSSDGVRSWSICE